MNPTTATTDRQRRRALLAALAAAFLPIAVAACGDDARTGRGDLTQPTTTNVAERPTGTVDELIHIGSGRLHIRCRGAGTETVLLLAGWGGGNDGWDAVEPAVAGTARVCSYARFGTGRSDPPATVQTFATQSTDLHRLLERAGEPGPYVLVGHSFGGAQAVAFASQYADEVTAVVLIDASPTTWPQTVCEVPAYEATCGVMHDPMSDPERLDTFAAFADVAAIRELGDLPMRVLTATHRTDPALRDDELARLDEIWAEGVERWAELSTSSEIVSIEATGHHIQIDQPQIVIDEILELLG